MSTLQRAAALAALSLAFASPALAHPVPPGSSAGWVQQQPTRQLGTEQAQVLTNDLAYLDVGSSAFAGTAFGGLGLGYARGMGNGGELVGGLQALVNTGGPFSGGIFGGWKQQLSRSANMAVAVDGKIGLFGLGGATSFALGVGLPLTFDAGPGHLTAEPRLVLPSLAAGTGGGVGQVGVNYIWPVANRWSVMGDIAPTFNFGGGFSAPIAVGARFSPTATSHVDFTFGSVQVTPNFGAQLGLVNITGHVGF